jgi:hypothetical protein
MRIKKIRGHKRIWKEIEQWENSHLHLDIDYLKLQERTYAKIYVHPFCDFSGLNSEIPQPKGATRKLILEGLFEIYESWKNQLEVLNEPYYLKIWLYEPRFSKSQVVCSVRDCIDFYNLTFYNPNSNKKQNPNNFGSLKQEITKFSWGFRYDEEHMNNAELGYPEDYCSMEEFNQERIRVKKKLKKPHRVTKYAEPIGDATEAYSFKKGMVWIGEKLG